MSVGIELVSEDDYLLWGQVPSAKIGAIDRNECLKWR